MEFYYYIYNSREILDPHNKKIPQTISLRDHLKLSKELPPHGF